MKRTSKKIISGSTLFGLGILVTTFSIASLLDHETAALEGHGIEFVESESNSAVSGPNLKRVAQDDLPKIEVEDAAQGIWEAGSRDGLRRALKLQLERCQVQSQDATWNFAGKKVSRARWCVRTVEWFLSKLDTVSNLNELYQLARNELEWYQSVGREETHDVLFTGYFYPILKAKKKADSVYKYPIYRKPSDLVQITVGGRKVWRRKAGKKYTAYYTRAQIAAGALKGKGLEIAYVDNPVDPYLLEVQGSGALLIQNGESEEKIILNYGGQNGAGYVSLGKIMRNDKIDEKYINMQGIKRYFIDEHPEDWSRLSNKNPSQVFFQEANDGPYGSAGALLTPKHSIAVDTSQFPMGAVALVQTDRPSRIEGEQALEWKNFAQFMVAQDTGGAIRSPGRVDLYYGSGSYAEVAAGQTAHLGNLFFMLVPDELQAKPTPQFQAPGLKVPLLEKKITNVKKSAKKTQSIAKKRRRSG